MKALLTYIFLISITSNPGVTRAEDWHPVPKRAQGSIAGGGEVLVHIAGDQEKIRASVGAGVSTSHILTREDFYLRREGSLNVAPIGSRTGVSLTTLVGVGWRTREDCGLFIGGTGGTDVNGYSSPGEREYTIRPLLAGPELGGFCSIDDVIFQVGGQYTGALSLGDSRLNPVHRPAFARTASGFGRILFRTGQTAFAFGNLDIGRTDVNGSHDLFFKAAMNGMLGPVNVGATVSGRRIKPLSEPTYDSKMTDLTVGLQAGGAIP
jgi:hypothetical protein